MVDSHGRFVWYELATTDVEAAKAFYAEVAGWGTRDASAPGMPYTLFTAGEASVAGLSTGMLISRQLEWAVSSPQPPQSVYRIRTGSSPACPGWAGRHAPRGVAGRVPVPGHGVGRLAGLPGAPRPRARRLRAPWPEPGSIRGRPGRSPARATSTPGSRRRRPTSSTRSPAKAPRPPAPPPRPTAPTIAS